MNTEAQIEISMVFRCVMYSEITLVNFITYKHFIIVLAIVLTDIIHFQNELICTVGLHLALSLRAPKTLVLPFFFRRKS